MEEMSDDDYDELIDDRDQDDDESKPEVGPLSGAITRPRHVTTSCKQLHELVHSGTVELCPSYQRDVVWPESKMILLIQSLMLNYYIPPVLFAIVDDPIKGPDTRVCIDGKQRCTSIVQFMDGAIPFVAPNKDRYWYRRMTGQRGKLLPDHLRKKFDLIQVQAVEYESVSLEVQRDLFQRIQLGVPLSPAEKLQAIAGPWSDWIAELVKKYCTEPNTLIEAIPWDHSRAKPFRHVASFILLAYNADWRKVVSATDIRKFIERSDGPDAAFRRKIEMALSLFVRVAVEYRTIAFESAPAVRVAPVEWWFSAWLIYSRMGSSTVTTLAKDIGEMRVALRKAHRDIFTNSRVASWIFRYLDNLPFDELGPGDQVAAAEWAGEDVDSSESLAKKRKRAAREEEDDPDYRGAPVPRSSRSDVVGNTRSAASKTVEAATRASPRRNTAPAPIKPAIPAPPAPPAIRPPASARHVPNSNPLLADFAQNFATVGAGGQGYQPQGYAQPGFAQPLPSPQYTPGYTHMPNLPPHLPQQAQNLARYQQVAENNRQQRPLGS